MTGDVVHGDGFRGIVAPNLLNFLANGSHSPRRSLPAAFPTVPEEVEMVDVARKETARRAGTASGQSGLDLVRAGAGRVFQGADGLARRAPVAFGLALMGAGVLLGYWTGSRRR